MRTFRKSLLINFTILLSFLLVSLSHRALANVSDIQFKHYEPIDGLSQSTVTDVVEDKLGFMWFATTDGLNRFDGYEFIQYNHITDDPTSIPDQFIRKIFIDSRNNMWIATHNGLAKYLPEEDGFVTYNAENSALHGNLIITIAETHDGKLLVTDPSNLYTFDIDTNEFTVVSSSGMAMPPEIRFLFTEKDRTWIGSNKSGNFMLDNANNQLYDLSQPNPWNITLTASYLSDVKIYDGQYWVATNEGLIILNTDGLEVNRYTTASSPAIVHDMVRSIQRLANGDVWLGTQNGISIIAPESGEITSIANDNAANVGLQDTLILRLFRDSRDSMWVGTYAAGVHQFNQDFTNIKHFKSVPNSDISLSNNMVWALDETQHGKVWVATQSGGVNLFDPDTGLFEHFLKDFPHAILDLVLDDQQKVWLATTGGLFAFAYQDGQLADVAAFFDGAVLDRVEFFDGRIWIVSEGAELTSVDASSLQVEQTPLPNQNLKRVLPIFLDSRQNLWLKTNNGLALFNINDGQFNQLIINIQNHQPTFIDVMETEDAFWVSTLKRGLMKLDKESYRVVAEEQPWEGETNNSVISVVSLGDSIWQATQIKIKQFSISEGKVVREINRDLLDYSDLNEGTALVTENGHLYFGSTRGFHVIDPAKLQSENLRINTSPVITELRVFNRPVTTHTPDSPLTKPVHLSDEITLKNSDSPFSLRLAQLNLTNPKTHSYRYKLQGLSDDWLEADVDSRLATFTNLGFGSYDFYVQSRKNDGPWSPSTHLKINIKPPIWLHRNALVLYGFFVFLLFAYWFKQYQTKRQNQRAIQESEERLKLTLWSSGDELWDWDIFRGQVFRANTWGTLDFPQDDIRANSSYQANIHQDDIPKIQRALKQHLEDDSDHFQVTYRARTFKGDWIWLLDRGKVVRRDNNNQPLRMTGTLKNISHLKQAEEQLKLFKRSIENISDGVFIADTDFRFISVNQAYCRYTGETREQALASYLKFHQYPEAFTEEVKKSLQQKGNWFGEVESRRANGEKYEMELNVDAVQSEDGKISHYVGVFSDITSRKSTEKELLKLANTDPLTEMPNRSFFQASHGNLVRKGAPHALLCLDMDNFKKINDSMGHQTGDILIKQIGKRLQKISGVNSTCYRLGGDEFAILIDNTTDMHHITHFAQRILDDMARPFLINKQEFVLGASVGMAFYPEDGNTPQELLKNADTAMYFAKNAGGNKYQFFSGEMNQTAVRQLQIENLIRHGLKEDLFTVFYQPKVDIASGKLVSMEALVRFEHPEKGIVSPAQFIPLSEETGQIIDIGERVMQKACEDTKRWVAEGLFTGRVAINISARQFELPDLDDRIDRILQKVGLSPLHLECEITEGTLMQNPEQALRMMERLREKGIHLALDDFGTGYSSLAYLKQFPLNTLKIDKAFIDDIATSNVDKHMTAAIINIAHNLGLKVVAEGVEQEKQLAILRRYECEMLQGYLYSKPLSSSRFERLLRENQQLTHFISPTDA